ncbi:hypothetical protein R2R35_19025 [Anaerocolumna sp. AGMB13020]|uniref:hypothetical protein n=1 Tax=Anaerocolumna sp. AGMB13020 TaxID=3081750 RepID=UPI002954939E|nr:hypothetical protein [Anaerocolumna sp. AGMB13020]WOO35869.1 hypothetical protein R2R35_19025 [Anaerocolumna sp. AGMB13020]
MFRPRINEFQTCKAVASGWKGEFQGVLEFMDEWISGDEASSPFTSPDFLCFNEPMDFLWIKLLPNDKVDTKGFEIIDFLGGLYVSAIAKDDNIEDLMKTINDLKIWINEHNFELDFRSGRYRMTRRITSDKTSEVLEQALGYGQLEVFIPITISTLDSSKKLPNEDALQID